MIEKIVYGDNSTELQLFYSEISRIEASDYVYGPVIRSAYVVECCTGGFGFVEINGTRFKIEEGDCYVLMAGDKVAHITTHMSYRSEAFCLIGGHEIKRVLRRAGITSESPFVKNNAYEEVVSIINDMVKTDNDKTQSGDYLRISYIYKLFSALLKGRSSAVTSSAIIKAIGIIDLHYEDPLSVDYLARSVGLERSYFSVLFRKHTGLTPHAYLNTVRINRASTLMSDTDLSLTEIATRVGLEPTAFSRMFKRQMGIAPSQYRQNKT